MEVTEADTVNLIYESDSCISTMPLRCFDIEFEISDEINKSGLEAMSRMNEKFEMKFSYTKKEKPSFIEEGTLFVR